MKWKTAAVGSALVVAVTTLAVPVSVAAPASAQATVSSLSAPAPTARKAQNHCFQSGQWYYLTEGSSAPGVMTIKVYGKGKRARFVRGTYRSADWRTNGEIHGTLNSPCGEKWVGTFKDKSTPWNEGPFVAVFDRRTKSFSGYFKTHDGCSWAVNLIVKCKYRWGGSKI
jgi:hypothetical protein